MKEGDKIRFLNAVGGGRVKRFLDKNTVIIEEDTGFETPVPVRECIVTETGGGKPREGQQQPDVSPAEHPAAEMPGGDSMNIYLACLPVDIKQLSRCKYETYLVNDSNYCITFNYMNKTGGRWISRCADTMEPNTLLFIEEFARELIYEHETVCIQFIAFKRDRPFELKSAYSVDLKIDGFKIQKQHSFKPNEFFDDEALVCPVVLNDGVYRKQSVPESSIRPAPVKIPAPAIIEVDLHINNLLDTTAGMSSKEIFDTQMDAFRKIMDSNLKNKGQKIVFIHGKGDGILKKALVGELNRKYRPCSVQDASFLEYGFGATMVTIRQQ
ncbi:MAG: DUF2027 domain-containing protein [Dysgonamonadaceae bacterium]|jgi:hypothetical protein|nr:DUF2027 domain-containing protein [Dysgonamonadaceae bacterium]